jgi:hypothetical protein
MKQRENSKADYFLPLPACFDGSETCFLSLRFWSFSRCSFLCCSKPSAFFAFFDKIVQPSVGNRNGRSKTLLFNGATKFFGWIKI